MSQTHMDGSKRYLRGLLKGLLSITDEWIEDFQIHVSINGWITDLHALPYISPFDSSTRILTFSRAWLRHTFTMSIFLVWHYFLRLVYSRPVSSILLSIKKLFPKTWRFFKSYKDAYAKYRIAKGNRGSTYDLVHLTIPQNYSIVHNSKYVMTVLDFTHLYFSDFHMGENLKITKQGLEFALDRNADFIAISESTRKDLLKEYKVSPDQVSTIYLGCDKQRFKPTSDHTTLLRVKRRHKLGSTPYFLSVGTLEPRKNLSNTLRAFLLLLEENPELDLNFVVVGRKGWKYEEIFRAEFASDRIIFLQTASDNDLAPLYSGSIALCYASFYEGFGLPPLEAMCCGTPVIFGNNSSLPEIVGDGGLPVNPGNVADIKEKMLSIALDKVLRERLALNAYARARLFSWERTARETIRVYEQVLQESGM